jgi:nitrogen fixation NifU-like protein
MSNLNELYRELILDHNKNPRNFGDLNEPTKVVEGFNPLCGDKIKLYIKINNDVIEDIKFIGTGCAISVASASMLTDFTIGKNVKDSLSLYQTVHEMLTGITPDKENETLELGKLMALSGVKEYPSRIKCATLSWHALNEALTSNVNLSLTSTE